MTKDNQRVQLHVLPVRTHLLKLVPDEPAREPGVSRVRPMSLDREPMGA